MKHVAMVFVVTLFFFGCNGASNWGAMSPDIEKEKDTMGNFPDAGSEDTLREDFFIEVAPDTNFSTDENSGSDSHPQQPDTEVPEDITDSCPPVTTEDLVNHLYSITHTDQCEGLYPKMKMNCPDISMNLELSCEWAVVLGENFITPNGLCEPDRVLNYAEFAKILVLFFNLGNFQPVEHCTKFDTSTWYYEYLDLLYTFDIIDCEIPPGEDGFGETVDVCYADQVIEDLDMPEGIEMNGGLQFVVETPHPDDVVWPGVSEIMTARYNVYAFDEPYTIKRLSIINDLEGLFDEPTEENLTSKLWISCTPGFVSDYQWFSADSLNGGNTSIYVDCRVPGGMEPLQIQVAFDVGDWAGDNLGVKFRLGIQEAGNSSETFEAVGELSNRVINEPKISGQEEIGTFTVVETPPDP